MINHITYTNHKMTISADKCKQSALKNGCDSSKIYRPHMIDNEFYQENKEVLNQERGAGYWLWKPYIILTELHKAQENDIIVYTDAGVEFVSDVDNLIKEMTHDIMLFGNGHRHGTWCKMDVLKGMDCEQFKELDQVQASCLIIVNSRLSRSLVSEWLHWCTKENFIDDTPSYLTNDINFKEHRHDQAILTNIAYLYNIPFNRWPAQYRLKGNEKYKNKYGQVFLHLGLRNDGTR